jgi:hypothetical protein
VTQPLLAGDFDDLEREPFEPFELDEPESEVFDVLSEPDLPESDFDESDLEESELFESLLESELELELLSLDLEPLSESWAAERFEELLRLSVL